MADVSLNWTTHDNIEEGKKLKDASEASLDAYSSGKKKFTLHADLHMKLSIIILRSFV